ncbi:MAG: hypothetical protein RL732_321 [Bacteroidota bacterium]
MKTEGLFYAPEGQTLLIRIPFFTLTFALSDTILTFHER